MNEKQISINFIHTNDKNWPRIHDNIQKQTRMFGNLIRFW